MKREELLERICYTDYTSECSACDGQYNCQDCKDAINSLLDEYDKQIRTDAIEEYKLKLLNAQSNLVNDIHKAKVWVEFKRQAIDIAEQLKSQEPKV